MESQQTKNIHLSSGLPSHRARLVVDVSRPGADPVILLEYREPKVNPSYCSLRSAPFLRSLQGLQPPGPGTGSALALIATAIAAVTIRIRH